MSLTIDDPETVAAINALAQESHQSVEEVLREAVKIVRARREEATRRRALLTKLQERFARLPSSGLKADKAFFDELGGNL